MTCALFEGMIHFVLFYLLHQNFAASIPDADGVAFEDSFKRFEQGQWRKDHGTRHCGAIGGCMWASEDNLQFLNGGKVHPDSGALMISMRNDCEKKYCCESEKLCTSYTSGQVTSQHTYSYGSFFFSLRIETEKKDYRILSTSFKSVHCLYSPSPGNFPYELEKPSVRGYCEKENADLFSFSSNRDLCGRAYGNRMNICARFTWVIDNKISRVFNFHSHGSQGIDYDIAAIFLDNELVAEGKTQLIQDFDVLIASGKHKLEVFGWERCCAGTHDQGYKGWNIKQVLYKYSPISEEDVHALQARWGQAIKDISALYLQGGDFVAKANDAAADLYCYGQTDLYCFRPTAIGALSYFVGGSNVGGGLSEDQSFAHNNGKGWSEVEFENVQIDLVQNMAIAMGHYILTQATGDGAASKTRVEFTFGYKRDSTGKARIFLHHSSMPYSNATPIGPVTTESIISIHKRVGAEAITAEDVHSLLAAWGDAIKRISAAYLADEDYMKVANAAAATLYGYDHSNVLFKLTKAAENPFRTTATEALSYFAGGTNVQDWFSEDHGFAHNGCEGLSEITFEDVHMNLNGPVAIVMGHYLFTQATCENSGDVSKVEFTFGYKRDSDGTPRIFLHHSSVLYARPRAYSEIENSFPQDAGNAGPSDDARESDAESSDLGPFYNIPLTPLGGAADGEGDGSEEFSTSEQSQTFTTNEQADTTAEPTLLNVQVLAGDDGDDLEITIDSQDENIAQPSGPPPSPVSGDPEASSDSDFYFETTSDSDSELCPPGEPGCLEHGVREENSTTWARALLGADPFSFTEEGDQEGIQTAPTDAEELETEAHMHAAGEIVWNGPFPETSEVDTTSSPAPKPTGPGAYSETDLGPFYDIPLGGDADTNGSVGFAVIPTNPSAWLCFNLQRMIKGVRDAVLMKIGLCFSSIDGRQALLTARVGDQVFKYIASLPFDASSRIGQYRIDWHPDCITWKAGGEELFTLRRKTALIPNNPLHMKFFIVPEDPIHSVTATVEHHLYLHSVGYEKLEIPKPKDELIVLDHDVAISWRLILGILIQIIFTVLVCICLFMHCSQKEEVDGYVQLNDDTT